MLDSPLLEPLVEYLTEYNTLNDYMYAFLAFLAVIVFLKFFRQYFIYKLKKFAKKTKTSLDDMAVEFIEQLGLPFNTALSFYIVSRFLTLPDFIDQAIFYLLVLVVSFYFGKGVFRAIDFFIKEQTKAKKKEGDAGSAQLIRLFGTFAKIFLVIIAVLLVFSNLGFNISSLLAGVGIGGIAIAFALQNILGDLFSSFSIFFDKPFVEGDFIIVDGDMGTVKKIGLKSTRIQSLQGHELVISNRELTSVRVNNYTPLEERRVVFSLGVVYGTPVKKLEKIPKIIKQIIDKVEKARFDRAHFSKYGDFSLNFEIVYYAETADYAEYMDINEKIHLGIARAFEKEKIEFAYPTQKIFVENQGK